MTTKKINTNCSGRFRFLWADRGSILIVALWSVALLGSFAIAMGSQVRQKIALADRVDNFNFLYGVSEMGVARGLESLSEVKEKKETYYSMSNSLVMNPNSFKLVAVEDSGGTFTLSYQYPVSTDSSETRPIYGIQDEGSKLNLNTADAKTLRNLFQIVASLDEEKASEIAYSVVDWRDKNNSLSHPDYGAEDDYYEDLALPYEAKDYDFETIEELLLVRGMTEGIYNKVKPYVTIYGLGVNINTAFREVLLSLGLGETLADKIIQYRSGLDRTSGTADDQAFPDVANIADKLELSSAEKVALMRVVDQGLVVTTSNFFRIHSQGENLQKKVALDLTAVVDLDGKIHYWKFGIPRKMTEAEIKELEGNLEGGSGILASKS